MTEIHGLIGALFLGIAMTSGLVGLICYSYLRSRRAIKVVHRQASPRKRPKLILGDMQLQSDGKTSPPSPTKDDLFTIRKGGWG